MSGLVPLRLRASAIAPQIDVKSRFERGAVVRCQDQNWVVWAYPQGKFGHPIVLPLVVQNAPQHRSHVRVVGAAVGLTERIVLVIRTLDPKSVPRRDCEQLGQCSEAIITQIGLTMRRAIEARIQEQPPVIATA